MSRKIKIQTVDKTKSTELENTLKENICTKTLETNISPTLIEKTRKIMDKLHEEDNNPCNDNTGDASAYTNNELDTYDYYVIAEEYINKIILPLFIKADSENANNIDSMNLANLQSMLVSLFKEHNIMSLDDAINNKKLYDIVIADLIVFNFNEPLVNPEKLIHVLVDSHLPQFKSNYNKYYGVDNQVGELLLSIPEENLGTLIPENNPVDNNMEPVNVDWIKGMPSDIKKLEEFMGPPHSNTSDSVEEAKNTCTDELLDDMRHKSREINFKIKQFKENNAKDIYFKKINKDDILNEVTNEILEDNSYYEEVNHPDHYNVYDVEVVEMMERIFGIEETMSWCKLNAFKYRMRAGEKPTSTVEKDLKKEKWCLNKYKELKSKK